MLKDFNFFWRESSNILNIHAKSHSKILRVQMT